MRMREIADHSGDRWRVYIGRESYGIMTLLFDRVAGDEVRKTPIEADTRHAAMASLQALSDAELVQRLGDSRPWDADSSMP